MRDESTSRSDVDVEQRYDSPERDPMAAHESARMTEHRHSPEQVPGQVAAQERDEQDRRLERKMLPEDERMPAPMAEDGRVAGREDERVPQDGRVTGREHEAVLEQEPLPMPVADRETDHEPADLRTRWEAAQLRFIDDPQSAAEEARSLVAEALSVRQREVEEIRSESDDTEELRTQVARYRDIFEVLVPADS